MTVGEVRLDVCKDGCAGIWFHAFELNKFDESNRFDGDELLEIRPAPGVVVDQTVRYKRPECTEHPLMMRHFFRAKRGATVDECPACGGDWLDSGELRTIRDDFPTEEAESTEQLAKAHKFANHFRIICPSYYIPGEQKWGAF